MGIPVPSRLTEDEIQACERFSLAVWGVGMFDYTPTHDGKHGYGCNACLSTLRERDREQERVRSIPQPWETREAA